MKYIVQYTVPYVQRCLVGTEADSPEDAIMMAKAWTQTGDTVIEGKRVCVLSEGYQSDVGLEHFTVERALEPDEPWPEVDEEAEVSYRPRSGLQIAQLLIDAYRRGELQGGSIDWEELDEVCHAALAAVGEQEDLRRIDASHRCSRLAVVLEGGIVQSVIADHPETAPAVAVVDYDTEGQEPGALSLITQSDGSRSKAHVVESWIEPARIDLDEVFRRIDS